MEHAATLAEQRHAVKEFVPRIIAVLFVSIANALRRLCAQFSCAVRKAVPTDGIKLHIGGTVKHEGWAILDALPSPVVGYVGNCNDLSFLADESCCEVDASHVFSQCSMLKNGPGNRRRYDRYWKNHRPAAKAQASVAERPHSAPAWTESAVVAEPQSANYLLASLSAAEFGLLRPHLTTKELVGETVLFEAGDIVDCVYFPHTAIVSLVVTLSTGEMIEAAMVGRDGIVNGLAALGQPISLCRAVVQMGGASSVLDLDRLRRIVDQRSAIRRALVRHEQFLLSQAQQSAACNAAHSVEARLSRWLLRAHDLNGSHTLLFTQEFLAEMLGVRRTSVSLVANTLQQAGLIKYRRGQIQITNLEALQEASCECHKTVQASYQRLLA